jgi:hypothetical protein
VNQKIGSKPLSSIDFASRFVKKERKTLKKLKNMNLNAKSTDEKGFEPIFEFKAL